MNPFISGFASELCKMAAPKVPPSLLSRIPGKAKALGLVGAGVGTYAFGKKKGVEKGEAELGPGMQAAYQMGAEDMQKALLAQLQGG